MADDVCEYYGPRVLPSAAGGEREQSERHPDDPELPSELHIHETLDERDTTMDDVGGGLEEAKAEAEHIASQLDALELLVSVSAAPLSREEFKARYERHVEAFARDAAASEAGASAVDFGFIETATDGAKDVAARRCGPLVSAMAQLDVLVGDTTFTVSSFQEASLMAGMVFGAPADPLNDPPQKLVDVARLAAERL
jgi:hypothetical protein